MGALKRLGRATIWHPTAIPKLERKYAVPRLWALEIGGKVALFALLAVYIIALRVAAANEPDGSRDAVSVFVAIAMLFPLLRLWVLGIEERDRKAV